MVVYNTIFALLIFLRYGMSLSWRQRYLLYCLVLVVLLLFSAFRLDVGCDWENYLLQFNSQGFATLDDALEHSEPLWWAILHFTHELGLPYPWVNVFSSVIAFLGIHVLARRQTDPLGFLVLLFPVLIINMPMSGIRQGAAIGLICIAFSAFVDKKLISFVLFTLIASTVHSSAVLFLLLAPLATGEYSKKRLFLAGLIAIPGLVVLMGMDSGELAQSRYIGTGYDASGAIFRLGLLFMTSVLFFGVLKKNGRRLFLLITSWRPLAL